MASDNKKSDTDPGNKKSDIDTGTGGFDIDGKVYTYDTGVPESDASDRANVNHGNVKVDKTKKDLSNSTKSTLAQYLSDVTLGKKVGSTIVPNQYPVSAEAKTEIKLLDEKGYPTQSVDSQQKQFSELNKDLTYTNSYPVLSKGLKKGKSSEDKIDGNKLLQSVIKTDNAPDVIKNYTTETLKDAKYTDKKSFTTTQIDNTPTLADYLSKLTQGSGNVKTTNRYPVSADLKSTIKLSDEKGYPVQSSDSQQQKFVDLNDTKKNPTAETYSSTMLEDNKKVQYGLGNLSDNFKKGKKNEENKLDGHQLLQQVSANNLPPAIGNYTTAVLKNNRFSNVIDKNNPFTTPQDLNSTQGNFNPKLTRIKQEVSMGRLATIGPTLTLRAGIELGATNDQFDPNSTAAAAGALLPGVAQLAISRVRQEALNAKEILNTITSEEDINYISPGSLSWGSLNNTEDQWSGIAAIGMSALSAALIAGLLVIIETLSFLLGVAKTGKVVKRDKDGRYVLGQSTGYRNTTSPNTLFGSPSTLLTLDVGKLLNITPTTQPFSKALKTGFYAFFGLGDGSMSVASAASKVLGPDAGFNAIVARGIIRSSLTLIDQLKGIGGNPISIAKSILGLIDVLKSSKIISACNVFAQLGDSILTLPESFIDKDTLGAGLRISDDVSNNVITSMRNRIPGTLKLAWSSNRSPALLMGSAELITAGAASNLGAPRGFRSDDLHGKITIKNYDKSNVTRISVSDVEAFEKKLDSEYVPFYFHDIRTNEIVSFHAFLSSLSDDYTSNYESIDGYGRVEPVKIYKNTQRKIGLSFYVISTSQNDHDDMWIKINKLTTLLYPQYTEGKKVGSDDYKFTQPFSQLIGAAPLVRLRLGDLFRSNYSKFNLAKLFGLGNSDFTLNKKTLKNATISEKNITKNFSPGDICLVEGQNYELSKDTTSNALAGALSSVTPPVGITTQATGKDNAPYFNPPHTKKIFEIKIIKDDPNNKNNVIGEVQITTDTEIIESLGNDFQRLKVEYNDPKNPNYNYVGGKYSIPKSDLRYKKAETFNISQSPDNEQFIKELDTQFMSDDNAVVKSFKNTGGKGLAGFIESMNFDWYDRVPWVTDVKDRVSPMMCKVTISFAPIHDISPGIDHFGINRAPIYPVGLSAPNKNKK